MSSSDEVNSTSETGIIDQSVIQVVLWGFAKQTRTTVHSSLNFIWPTQKIERKIN
jgi:hypothetical protein